MELKHFEDWFLTIANGIKIDCQKGIQEWQIYNDFLEGKEERREAFIAGQEAEGKEIFAELDKLCQDCFALDMDEFINSRGGNIRGLKEYQKLKRKYLGKAR